ncbi:MAG: hypothetical protein M3217_13110 [Actinomycetota bacterium]|nr:hypothetical protein [Actinomycetota bacterium]
MATDLRVVLPNRPGMLLAACEALDEAGVTLQSVCGDLRPGERWGYLHLLVDDPAASRSALEGAGFQVVSEHDVELFPVEGPGHALTDAVSRYTGEGRNVEIVYLSHDGRLVIGTEDMRKDVPGVKVKDARY